MNQHQSVDFGFGIQKNIMTISSKRECYDYMDKYQYSA